MPVFFNRVFSESNKLLVVHMGQKEEFQVHKKRQCGLDYCQKKETDRPSSQREAIDVYIHFKCWMWGLKSK